MWYLLIVTLVWAFSFSLIGVYLRGVDPWFSVLLRAGLASLVFLPFISIANIKRDVIIRLLGIGAIQLGLMYGFYYHSFLYLTVPEVLLFTIMTPIYITLLKDLLDRQFNPTPLAAALVAVAGALLIRYDTLTSDYLFGMFLVQGANLCFASGQVFYKRLIAANSNLTQHNVFGLFFLGAFAFSVLSFVLFGNAERLPATTTEWSVLIYLGVVASGLGYFAWNKGATIVSVGQLAVMNNLLIPAGIIVNVAIWNREADLLRLTLGGVIILAAMFMAKKSQ
ncbi:EamA family transporter [Psychrosphaera ytuae]|uniref:EamA family transporter n=1 Tax=Psychrosphaera ytuae TaxID=2820710 RepID=A0A975DBB3_9GAMM|nr:EamA family transporter [Psychrosphaera ytuae]QTH64010.1 EamA family transporter [Psychrosphaera ytuae]